MLRFIFGRITMRSVGPLIIALTSFLLVGIIISLSFYLADERDDMIVQINVAGRQRMLTERMSLTVHKLEVAQRWHAAQQPLQEQLQQDMLLFEDVLNSFKQGGMIKDNYENSIRLRASSKPELLALFAKITPVWTAYHKHLQSLSNDQSAPQTLLTWQSLAQQEAQQLLLMNDLVNTLQLSRQQDLDHLVQIRNGVFLLLLLSSGYFLWLGFNRYQRLHTINTDQLQRMALLHACLKKAHDVIIISEATPTSNNGSIIYVNDSFEQVTGYAAAEILGKTAALLRSPNADPVVFERIRDAIAQWQPVREEVLNRTKSGDEIWVELNITPITDETGAYRYWISVQRDITERKALDASLRVLSALNATQQQRLKLLDACLANANDVIIITEAEPIDFPSPKIVYVNQAFEKLTGYSAAEAIGQTPRMLQGKKTDRAVLDSIRYALKNWQPIRCEICNYTKNGEEFWMELDITPIADENGGYTHWISIQRDVTERISMQRQYYALMQHHQMILDNLPALIGYWDKHLCNVFANNAYQRWFGLAPEALKGLSFNACLGEEIYQRNQGYIEGVLSGKLQRFEQILPYNDNKELRYTLTEYIPHYIDNEVVGFYVVAFDISDLKHIEAENQANEDKLQKLFDLSPLGIGLVTMEGHFIEVNHAFERICGYSKEELNHLAYWDLTPSKYAAQEVVQREELNTTGKYGPYEKEYIQKSGAIISVVLNGVKILGADGQAYIWSIIEDISQRKHNELNLLKAKHAAELLAHSKAEFLANMSHEIRTPMNAIMGLSALALNKTLTDEVRDYVEKISHASEGLLTILNDILDFSKLEAGGITLEYNVFNVDVLLTRMQHLFAPSAHEKGLSFITQKDAQVPDFLLGDELRLQQVLVNLIGNAIKFTLQGSVSLQVSLLNKDDTEALVRFSVSDTGIGISEGAIDKLFNPFSQADTSTTRNFGGTGLGLSISDKLVQLMQGEFNVTSTIGKGSTFSIIMPLGIDASAETRIIAPQFVKTVSGGLTTSLQESAKPISGSHILVVEDYDLNQQVITEYLELSGMTVDVANNGKEALSMLATTHYDAVLMDVQMPVMGGIEATTLLRQQAHFANLPVIALTGGVTQEERAQCYASGMNAFVNKPIKMQELLSVLKDYL